MKTTRVMVVAREEKRRVKYVEAVLKTGTRCTAVPDFTELQKTLVQDPCNGLLIDVRNTVKATAAEKSFFRTIETIFPVARVNWDKEAGSIRLLYHGRAAAAGLEDFLAVKCASFTARTIRASERFKRHFGVLLSMGGEGSPDDAVRTITLDVSTGGCFLFAADAWKAGSVARVRFNELADKTPIVVEVRWHVDWGIPLRAPGMGVRFRDILDRQVEELGALLA